MTGVRYPGLPGDPATSSRRGRCRASARSSSFDLGSQERAEAFLAECELVAEATSFGGVHTSGERRARWGEDAVPEGFIRLSVGCEDASDLIADIEQALRAS